MLQRHFSVFKFIIALLIQSSSAIIQLSFYGFIAALSAEISRRVDKSFGQQKTTADGTQNARNERRTRFVYPGDQLIAPSLNYMCQRTDFSLRLNFQLELEIIIIELFQFFIRSLDSLKAPRVGKSVKINCRSAHGIADKRSALPLERTSFPSPR